MKAQILNDNEIKKLGYLINDEIVIYSTSEYEAIKTYVANTNKRVFLVERVAK